MMFGGTQTPASWVKVRCDPPLNRDLLMLSRFGKYIAARRLLKSSETAQMASGCRYILALSQRANLVRLDGDPWLKEQL